MNMSDQSHMLTSGTLITLLSFLGSQPQWPSVLASHMPQGLD